MQLFPCFARVYEWRPFWTSIIKVCFGGGGGGAGGLLRCECKEYKLLLQPDTSSVSALKEWRIFLWLVSTSDQVQATENALTTLVKKIEYSESKTVQRPQSN